MRNIQIAIFAIIITIMGFGAVSCGSSPASTTPRQEVPVAVQQPPDAREIAHELGGTSFTEMNIEANAFGMTSAGRFYIGAKRYAVNVFTDTESRDAWLKIAKKLGCNPKWMTSTSVAYPSLSPGGTP